VYSTSTILGDVLASANRVPEAERHYRRAVEVTNTLRQADPSNRQHRIDWFTAAGRLADLLATQPARMAEGRSLTQEVLRTLKPIVEGGTASDSEAEQYAWLLLTSPFADLRNPAAALPIVEKASQKRGGQIPRLLDMLALAQFGVGQRQQAIETEKRALALLPPTPSPTRTELEANLKRFERSAAPAAQRR
jgi:tetratricopeptide (TPR) repeat protein